MGFARERPRPGELAAATAHLRGLLELARSVHREPAVSDVLAAVARTVSETLGFGSVAINLYRPQSDEYEVTTVYGSPPASAVLLGQATTAANWSSMLDPRFMRRNVFFIPEEALAWEGGIASYTPELTPRDDAGTDAWRADDVLLVTLEGATGRHYGIISVDQPTSGLRPGEEELEVLSAVAAHAALAIESAHQVAELQEATARNRAVIETSLDGVVAIDRSGRVLEFNPAAERMFGFRSQDVVGRELVELIISPQERADHRLGLALGIERGDDWHLPGKRIEITAQRADGDPLPVELTLTLIPGSDLSGPIVYAFFRDLSEQRRGEEQLAYLAYHDPLTGLPNRILVEQELDLALARARRTERSVALMFVDLDDFKEVNDRFGHAAGDRLLAAVATRLRAVLRESDLLARQGGDEFIVVLADLEEDPGPAAEAVGDKLLDALREPFVVAGAKLRIGASIGVSVYPEDASDTEALMRHADVAMYQTKAAGGGRVTLYRPSGAILSRRAGLSSQLRRAIGRAELELHYQPVWRLDVPRGIQGVEALLRWRHPDRGLLDPESFAGLAERGAAGDALIEWMLAQACRQARDWKHAGLIPRLSLNVSPHQLLAPGYAERFAGEVRTHELQGSNFMIELTESAWTGSAAGTLSVIADLRAAGMWLAIDDFGAGYSSLSRLRELRFDVIKVAPRLLVDVPVNRTATAVLRAIIDLAQACDSAIVAQGVETAAQVEHLLANGIVQAQGRRFGRPVTAAKMTALLKDCLIGSRAVPAVEPAPAAFGDHVAGRPEPGPC